MLPGLVFTIEPIIVHLNEHGRMPGLRLLDDEWTVLPSEPLLSAQFEETVLITDTGFEVLTKCTDAPSAPAAAAK